MVTEQPVHLLDPEYDSWDEALLTVVDATIEYYERGVDLGGRRIIKKNTSRVQHPLARIIPKH
jgi:penicillin amidase